LVGVKALATAGTGAFFPPYAAASKTNFRSMNMLNKNKAGRLLALASTAVVAVALTGCIFAPPAPRPVYAAPPGVVYVQPTYVSPGVGYVWEYHPHYGWGWHHPQYGWHRGWR
jgi:hypothetical protein